MIKEETKSSLVRYSPAVAVVTLHQVTLVVHLAGYSQTDSLALSCRNTLQMSEIVVHLSHWTRLDITACEETIIQYNHLVTTVYPHHLLVWVGEFGSGRGKLRRCDPQGTCNWWRQWKLLMSGEHLVFHFHEILSFLNQGLYIQRKWFIIVK